MKTKLVYVLTCAPDKHYIEQALMAVYSARRWNSEAHIVLLVDDKTDRLLTEKRAEILQYVSEKKVVAFDDDTTSPMYRSRWIKTSVRDLVEGDFLFVDCDTIVCSSLNEIDDFKCEIGAVWDAHLLVEDFCYDLKEKTRAATMSIGVDIDAEVEYYSSGVVYVKDTAYTHRFYSLWHEYWKESCRAGQYIDQPAMAKANREMDHIIQRIPDIYNSIIFTQSSFIRQGKILHIPSYRNPSFVFSDKVLGYVRENGLNNEWLVASILNPCSTFLPFDYEVFHSNAKQRRKWKKDIAIASKGYGQYIDSSFEDFTMQSRLRWIVVALLRNRWYGLGAGVWMFWKRMKVLRKRDIKDNVCRK